MAGSTQPLVLAIVILLLPNLVFSSLSPEIEKWLRSLAETRTDLPRGRVMSILEQAKSRPEIKQLIENEFLVRETKFNLSSEEGCTLNIHTSLKVANPPAKIKEYLAWQKAIIAESEKLCNIHLGFQCQPSEECLCSASQYKSGRVAIEDADGKLMDSDLQCLKLSGKPCGQFDTSPKYFNPLDLLPDGDLEEIVVPVIRSRSSYCERSGRLTKGRPLPCEKFDFFPISKCLGYDESNQSRDLSEMISTLMTLGPESTCNEEKSKNLFNPDPAETDTVKRLQNIRDAAKDDLNSTDHHFCDYRQLLTCATGGKCECLAPFKPNSGTKKCEIPLWHRCGKEGIHERQVRFIEDAKLSSLVHHGLAMGLEHAKCDSRSECVPGPIEEGEQYRVCGCKGTKIGENCDIELSGSLKNIKPSSYPSDVPDVLKQLKILEEFNAKIIPFEKHMTQIVGQDCNDGVEKDAMEVRRFIRSIGDMHAMEFKSMHKKQNYLEIGTKAENAIKGKRLCKDGVMCTLGKCRTISQEEELKKVKDEVKLLATLTEDAPCMMNNTAPETDKDLIITHLKNLVAMKKPLCALDTDLLCLPKKGQLGFCQCLDPPAPQRGCKARPGNISQLSANATSTAGIEGLPTKIPISTILMIIFALIVSK